MNLEWIGTPEICKTIYQTEEVETNKFTTFWSYEGRIRCLNVIVSGLKIIPKMLLRLALSIMDLWVDINEGSRYVKQGTINLLNTFCATLLSPFAAASLIIRGLAGAILHPALILKKKILPPTQFVEIPLASNNFKLLDLPKDLKNKIGTFLEPNDVDSLSKINKCCNLEINKKPITDYKKEIYSKYFKNFFSKTEFNKLPVTQFEVIGNEFYIYHESLRAKCKIFNKIAHVYDLFLDSLKHIVEISNNKNLIFRVELKINNYIYHGFFWHCKINQKNQNFSLLISERNDYKPINSKTIPENSYKQINEDDENTSGKYYIRRHDQLNDFELSRIQAENILGKYELNKNKILV